MTVQSLSDFFVLNIRGFDYRVYIVDVDKKDALNSLNNFELGNKGVLLMEFKPNISPVDVI